jgi:hypothetical protein
MSECFHRVASHRHFVWMVLKTKDSAIDCAPASIVLLLDGNPSVEKCFKLSAEYLHFPSAKVDCYRASFIIEAAFIGGGTKESFWTKT